MRRLLYILPLFLAVACTHDNTTGLTDDILAIEGWIESDANPVVFVTSAVMAKQQEQEVSGLAEHILLNTSVSVTAAGRTYNLYPKLTEDYALGLYYTTDQITGKVGETYELDVKWRGIEAHASTTILPPGELDSIAVEKSSDVDTLYVIKVHVTPTPDRRYYRFFSKDIGRDSIFAPSYMGIYDSGLVRPDEMTYVDRGVQKPFTKPQYYYRYGDSAVIKLASIDAAAYDFWSKFEESQTFSGIALLPYNSNMTGNIDGALGYWFGYGITAYSVPIR